MRKIKFLKIYGERNTGTNLISEIFKNQGVIQELPSSFIMRGFKNDSEPYLKRFADLKSKYLPKAGAVDENIKKLIRERIYDDAVHYDRYECLGWKHCRPNKSILLHDKNRFKKTLFIVITKHPYFWVKSFYKNCYHNLTGVKIKKIGFEDFLEMPWVSCARDWVDKTIFDSVLELYRDKINGYVELSDYAEHFIHIQYESLINSPDKYLDRVRSIISEDFPLLQMINESAKKDGNTMNDYRKKYDIKKVVCEDFFIDAIEKYFTQESISMFGYDIDPRLTKLSESPHFFK
ncbi:hypothetical protein [Methylomagnum ishizawai]|uniref:hypothetical protein n=1 Tax=Methylomagnum ishizawai TaxID=1760988 RepID=UPI001C32E12F|nr:hypothetical protein [Methylomagnum ishizawai]BBL75934.1 hypothetical protein MishRS11D_30320 [Methylomagnum ishizawai]